MSELLMVEERHNNADGDSAPWILDRHGRRMQGRNNERRTTELRSGLTRHAHVHAAAADAEQEDVEPSAVFTGNESGQRLTDAVPSNRRRSQSVE